MVQLDRECAGADASLMEMLTQRVREGGGGTGCERQKGFKGDDHGMWAVG